MATTSGIRNRRLRAGSRGLPAWATPVAATAGVAAVTWAMFSRAFLNYDTLYGLIWGRDLVHGRLPDYEATLAPTPHPLATAVGALVSLLGQDGGYVAMLALGFLALGALVWGVFRLAQVSFWWPVGLLTALVVLTREPLLSRAVRAYVDIPFLALIAVAAVLEARRPRRGWPVLLLLALAGLLRPEGWLVAGAYWLYLAPSLDWPARLRAGALVAAAPVLWALSDLAVTGDPLHSLTGTRETAGTLGRPTGLDDVPEIMPRRLGEILRLVPVVGGTAGFFLGLYLARARSMLPAALAVLGGLGFIVLAIAGLPLLGRFLFLPAVMIAIFFGFAALGWVHLRAVRFRKEWAIGGVGLLVLLVLSTFTGLATLDGRSQLDRLDSLRDGIRLRGEIQNDLRLLTRMPPAGPLLRSCSPVYVPNHRPVPVLAYYLDRPPGEIVSARLERPRRGLFVAPATSLVEQKFVLDPRDPKRLDAQVPRDFRRVDGNRSWSLFEKDC